MRTATRKLAGGLVVVGGAIMLRPGTRAHRAVRHQTNVLRRHLRHLGGRLQGVSYRLRGQHPDLDVSDNLLADRIRSSLGPLEKRLDLPRIHVMAEGQVALLHGEVGTAAEADQIEAAVEAVSGVLGVESYVHTGLTRGDTRPSAGRAVEQPSDARRRLFDAAVTAGLDPSAAPPVVRGILAAFAERIPDDERNHVAAHLPADVRSMFSPPRRIRQHAPARTVPELVGRIASITEALPEDKTLAATRAVLRELRALIPESAADVATVLPAELRDLWEQR